MNKKQILWLQGELPSLVSQGIIDNQTAEKIREHYGDAGKKDYTRTMVMVFGAIGAVLAGLGIILLVAFNWEGFPRWLKLIIAFLPLLITQALGFFTLTRKCASSAWRETCSILICLAVAAGIALVSQTYNIPGDLGDYLLAWMLLSLPLVYIFNSNVVILFYLAGITAWSGYSQVAGGQAALFWILFLLIVPRIILEFRKHRYSNASHYIAWIMVICLTIATGITLEKVLPGLWILIYSSFFTCLYLTGAHWFNAAPGILQRPFQSAGVAGIILLAYFFTYNWPWKEIGWHNIRYADNFHHNAAFADYTVTAFFILAAIGLIIYTIYRRIKTNYFLALFPGLVSICYVLVSAAGNTGWPADSGGFTALLAIHILVNLYLLGCGIFFIIQGVKQRRIGLINGGTIIIAVLITLRFVFVEGFFEHLVVRGILFILLGGGFFLTNFLVSRFYKRSLS